MLLDRNRPPVAVRRVLPPNAAAAAAGMAISISSPYGSGSAVADERGSWWVRVSFPTVPSGRTFEVTAGGGSNARTFSFVDGLYGERRGWT